MNDAINDPKNYKKLSKPFETRMDAAAAMQGFMADVMKARQKWRIADAVVALSVPVEGEDETVVAMQSMGNSIIAPALLHRALGKAMESLVVSARDAMEPRAFCGDCGQPMQVVRPGDWQCVNENCPSNMEVKE